MLARDSFRSEHGRYRSRRHRHRLVRRHPRRDPRPPPVLQGAARGREPPRAAGRDQGAGEPEDGHRRLARPRQQCRHPRGLHLGDARDHALPDGQGLPARRQARVPGKADRDDAGRGRRTDRAGARPQAQVHHRLLAALQHQVRLCAQGDPRRLDRQAGERARVAPHQPRPGQQDHRPHQAVTGRDGVDPRPRLRAVVPGAGQARARLFAEQLRRHPGHERHRDARPAVDQRHHGQRRVLRGRRRLEPAAQLPPTSRPP